MVAKRVNGENGNSIPVRVKGLPVIGVLPDLLKGDPYEYLKNIMLEHGDMVALQVGPQTIYLASHPDYLQRILRDNSDNYIKPDMFYSGVKRVLGNGLVTSAGSFWLRQRRMIQPHLHRKQLAKMLDTMVEAIAETVDGWAVYAEGDQVLDFGEGMSEITMNVIMQTMFGKDLLTQEEITSCMHEMSTIIRYIGSSQFLGFLPEWMPRPYQQEFDRDIASFKETVQRIIQTCRDNPTESASLIQMLINTVDEETNEQMTEDQLFDEVITIFAAGFETTATALMWLLVALDQHPDILDKLRAEIDQVVGSGPLTFESIRELAYTRQVFMETLRYYTVAPLLPRMMHESDQLGDYNLPAGSTVLVFYHGVHHNPSVWEDPHVFNPDRFAPEWKTKQHSFAFSPFSAGPRKCAGDEFAMLEGVLAIALLLKHYRIELVPGQTFVGKLGATMRPRDGVKAKLKLRAALPESAVGSSVPVIA